MNVLYMKNLRSQILQQRPDCLGAEDASRKDFLEAEDYLSIYGSEKLDLAFLNDFFYDSLCFKGEISLSKMKKR